MQFSVQLERWRDIAEEIKPLARQQWEEIALDQEEIPYNPDFEMYAMMDAAGALQISTVRADAALAGYYINVLRRHPHYQDKLFGFIDVFYLLPGYRQGTVGLRLFMFMEDAMRLAGAVELVSISKTHAPVDQLFRRLGWRETGTTYTKLLRD